MIVPPTTPQLEALRDALEATGRWRDVAGNVLSVRVARELGLRAQEAERTCDASALCDRLAGDLEALKRLVEAK